MPGSTTSVFSEPDDYQAALRRDGEFDLIVTGHGRFMAELTRIELARMHLVAGVENLARIAFISLPSNQVRIALPLRSGEPLFSGGIALRTNEIVTHGPGQRMHERTDGLCRWRTIWLPAHDLVRYGRAMIGRTFEVPLGVSRWRPAREALRRLNRLHDDAIRMNKFQPRVVAGTEATRGLEQELMDALIECMRTRMPDQNAAASSRHADIMHRFEDILRDYPDRAPSIAEICAALDVPDRTLRACCKMHLGMGPHRYLHLRQMQRARRALRATDTGVIRISDIANRYGLGGLGRFAASYREHFGELPSDTMRRRAT